jgi:dihydropteroate synthase
MLLTEGDRVPLSRLDHALYLGRELQKAELCLERGEPYIQD